jgi:hypothetical protein
MINQSKGASNARREDHTAASLSKHCLTCDGQGKESRGEVCCDHFLKSIFVECMGGSDDNGSYTVEQTVNLAMFLCLSNALLHVIFARSIPYCYGDSTRSKSVYMLCISNKTMHMVSIIEQSGGYILSNIAVSANYEIVHTPKKAVCLLNRSFLP